MRTNATDVRKFCKHLQLDHGDLIIKVEIELEWSRDSMSWIFNSATVKGGVVYRVSHLPGKQISDAPENETLLCVMQKIVNHWLDEHDEWPFEEGD